jgi:uncharacterized membrane protein YkoI
MSQSTQYRLLMAKPALIIALGFSTQGAIAAKDLFKNQPSANQNISAQEMVSQDTINAENEYEEISEPAISSSDAALRAQQHAGGKVMNVRQFQNEDRTLYGVKVLQENGRMKTINVDANDGSIVE